MNSFIRAVFCLTLTLALLPGIRLAAQCAFTPTITGDTLLCPNETGVLTTQQYDAYQWYTRPFGGNAQLEPVAGATQQTFEVNSADVPFYAVVEATLEAGNKVTATCRGTFVAVKEGHPAYHRW